jgi:hypothetical protein
MVCEVLSKYEVKNPRFFHALLEEAFSRTKERSYKWVDLILVNTPSIFSAEQVGRGLERLYGHDVTCDLQFSMLAEIFRVLSPHQTEFVNTICLLAERTLATASKRYLRDKILAGILRDLDRLQVISPEAASLRAALEKLSGSRY